MAALLWVAAALGGNYAMFRYNTRPADTAGAPETWPAGLPLERIPGTYSLVMAVHPRCPCTRASVAELNRLMNKWQGRVRGHALLVKPFEFQDLWAQTDIAQRLKQLPHLKVRRDPGGGLAGKLGAVASGQVLLYSPEGRLLFDGGLTSFRGHEGPSLGQARLEALVAGREAGFQQAKVFGCQLRDKVCEMEGHGHGRHSGGKDGITGRI